MHFLPQLSDFVPLINGFYSVREQTNITLLTLIGYTMCSSKGSRRPITLMRTHNP